MTRPLAQPRIGAVASTVYGSADTARKSGTIQSSHDAPLVADLKKDDPDDA
jgi:hypothetical protein